MANSPLPQRLLPFLDGHGVSLPWYRWLQNLATGTGSQGPQGPAGPAGPAGSDTSTILSALAASGLDAAPQPTALDLLAAANLDLSFVPGANITLNGGSTPVYGGQITIASTGGGGSNNSNWFPLTSGTEPPNWITNGAGVPIAVYYTP